MGVGAVCTTGGVGVGTVTTATAGGLLLAGAVVVDVVGAAGVLALLAERVVGCPSGEDAKAPGCPPGKLSGKAVGAGTLTTGGSGVTCTGLVAAVPAGRAAAGALATCNTCPGNTRSITGLRFSAVSFDVVDS